MAVANGFGQVVTSGSVFMYDTGDTVNSYVGEPTTNIFKHYGTTGQGSAADNAVNFDVQGTTGFIRLGYGQTFGGYTIQPNDVVYRYDLGGYGCHYHGNDVSIPSGRSVTFTFDFYVSPGAGSYPITNFLANIETGTGAGMSVGAPNSLTGVWQTVSVTTGPTTSAGNIRMLLYPGACGGALASNGYVLYKNPQVELLPHKTPFTQTSRSVSGSLLPLIGNSTLNLSTVSFDSNAQMIFDGTDDKIDIAYYSPVNNSMSRSWEVVVRPTSNLSYAGIFGNKIGYGCSYYCNGGIYLFDGNWVFNWYDNSNYQFLYSGVSPTANQYFHIVGTYDATDQKPRIYVNGELKATYGSATNMDYGGSTYVIDIGWNSKDGGQHYFQGQIPITKYYQGKALSSAEVKQNYNKYKTRFNLT